jgi:hypothetical protein
VSTRRTLRSSACEVLTSASTTTPSVNGVATSASGTQLIIDELQAMFHRPIIGICNRTYGFLWDLIECTIQRDLLWPTTDVREGYKVGTLWSTYMTHTSQRYPDLKQILSKAIRDESKTRVVLMSHSQGGIILSAWIVGSSSTYLPASCIN